MPGRVFVDSNVLVYARDASEVEKQPKAMEWMRDLWRSRRGALSTQVLQEFYVTATQKLDPGMDRQAARTDVRSLTAWRPILVDASLLESAWALQDRYQLPWWDALIVAAAQAAESKHLLSEDFQDGQVFGGVKVINPFLHAPAEAV